MGNNPIPDFLSHYYEAADGPFRNLSDLPMAEAEGILQKIRQGPAGRFAGQRSADYLVVRRDLENRVR
jgi:hypothetical protein